MSVALKLLVLDTEAALARATSPRERASLKSALDGYKRTLDAADFDPEPRAARAPTVDPEAPAAEIEAMLPLDDEDLAAPDSPPSAEAVQGVIDRAVYRYAAIKNGKPLKVGDLATFGASMRMRAGVQRTADAVRARADIASRSSGRGSR